jgi:hypothetical protein
MWVIVRRRRPHALEFLDADPDPVDALIVYEMGHERLSHGAVLRSRLGKCKRA